MRPGWLAAFLGRKIQGLCCKIKWFYRQKGGRLGKNRGKDDVKIRVDIGGTNISIGEWKDWG